MSFQNDLKADYIRRGRRILQLYDYSKATGERNARKLAQVAQLRFGVSYKTGVGYAMEVLQRLDCNTGEAEQ